MLCTVLFALFACSQAMILCPPNYCDTVRCNNDVTAELCEGRFNPTGSMCSCCPTCVKQLSKGDNCYMSMLLGVPPSVECGKDTYCNVQTMKCEPRTCAMVKNDKQAILEESQKNGAPLLGLHVPECEEDGSYKRKQCVGSSCQCVSKDGQQISGFYAPVWESDDMTCNCARDQYEYMQLGIVGKMFNCDQKGNYEAIQCTGSVCGCADPKGALLAESQTVPIWKKDTLNC